MSDEPRPPCSRCGAIDPEYRDSPLHAAALRLLDARGVDGDLPTRDEFIAAWLAACEEVGSWPGVKRDEEQWDEFSDHETGRWDETLMVFGEVICSDCLTNAEITQLNLPFVAKVFSGEEKARQEGREYPVALSEAARKILADADRDREAGIHYPGAPE